MNVASDLFAAICDAYAMTQTGQVRSVSSRVWRMPTAQGDMAVKVYTEDQQARAWREVHVLAHLQVHVDGRCRVQRLQTSPGGPVWREAGRLAMVTRWETGAFKPYDTFTAAEWASLGASLASLHLQLDSLQAHDVQETLLDRLLAIDTPTLSREFDGELARAAAGADSLMLRAYVDTCLRLLEQYLPGCVADFPIDDPQRPIHNDYNQYNYLFGETLPPVILDWEASIGAPREFELVRCLNHLPLEAPALAASFVGAYLAVRPLRIERIAWAVDAACVQHALKCWVIRAWLDEPERFHSHLHGAMRMARLMDGARHHLVNFYRHCLESGTTT